MATERRRGVKHRHIFLTEIHGPVGRRVQKDYAQVIPAKKDVVLTLLPDDAALARKLNGGGSTTQCTMACAVHRQAHRFPHAVGDMVDWQATTVFILVAVDRSGRPIKCVRYYHNASWITKMNDEPRGGLKALHGAISTRGEVEVRLFAKERRPKPRQPGHGRDDGSRRGTVHQAEIVTIERDGEQVEVLRVPAAHGARLRYARATQGLVPRPIP